MEDTLLLHISSIFTKMLHSLGTLSKVYQYIYIKSSIWFITIDWLSVVLFDL
jgi:hypothetical protein